MMKNSIELLKSALDKNEEAVLSLLKKGKVDPNTKDHFRNPLLTAAAYKGYIKIVEFLLLKSVDPNTCLHGMPALMAAAFNNKTAVVKLLLESRADPDIEYHTHFHATPTVLAGAAGGGYIEIVELLLQYGANPNNRRGSALLSATREGHIKIVELLLPHMADPIKSADKSLRTAAASGHKDMVTFLLKKGANPNTKSFLGSTALSSAQREGHAEIVEILLKNGADSLQIPENVKGQPPAVTTPAIINEEPVAAPNSSGSLRQIVQGVGAVNNLGAVNSAEPQMNYCAVTDWFSLQYGEVHY